MKAIIVVPAFNESTVIFDVLKSLPKRLPGVANVQVVVVDDGSFDQTAVLAVKADVKVIRHLLNRGAGAATKTGIEYAKSQNADIIINFDADGQHHAADLPKLVAPIISGQADLVIGSRFLQKQKIPLDRLFLNWLANLVTLVMFGVSSTDSQSGFRAFSKKAAGFIDFKADRMDFSSEILLEAKRHNLRVVEIPTKAIYSSYSREKGQKNINAISVFARFLIKLLG